MNVTRPSGRNPRVAGLAASCSSAAKRIASPRVRSSPSGSASSARTAPACSPSAPRRPACSAADRVEHLERVAVDVAVVEDVLLDAAQRRQLGQHDGGDAEVLGQHQPVGGALGADDPLELGEHALRRHAGEPGRVPRTAARVAGLELEARARPPGAPRAACAAGRRRAPPPRPSAAAAPRGRPARRAGRAARRPPSGSAIALIVKSRAARSAAMSPSRRRTRSTFQPPRPTTRHAPNAPESSNAVPPAALATAPAAARGSPATATSKSLVARPSSRSRTAPPTSQAGSPASAARAAGERLRHGP